MDEVEVDVEDRGLACGLGDEVLTARLFRRGCGVWSVVVIGFLWSSVASCLRFETVRWCRCRWVRAAV